MNQKKYLPLCLGCIDSLASRAGCPSHKRLTLNGRVTMDKVNVPELIFHSFVLICAIYTILN